MKPWRLLIESGHHPQLVLGADQPTPAIPPGPKETPVTTTLVVGQRSRAWDLLKEARLKERAAIKGGRPDEVEQIAAWVGGGIAIMAALLDEAPEALLVELKGEVPVAPFVPPEEMSETERRATFIPVERHRATPPPGAPRPLDMSTLTPEEREEMGIIMPEGGDLEVGTTPTTVTISVSDPRSRGVLREP